MNPFGRIGDDPNGDYFYSFDAQEDNFSIAASSFHPGGCNFALPRRLGPLHQGLDQHLALQPGQRGADQRLLQFVDRPVHGRAARRASTSRSRHAPAARSSAPTSIDFWTLLDERHQRSRRALFD